MAEEGNAPIQKPGDAISEMAVFLIPLVLLSFIVSSVFVNVAWWESLLYSFLEKLIYPVFFLLTAMFISLAALLYYSYKLSCLLEEEQIKGYREKIKLPETLKNERWQRILDHINSDHPNDWRIAILDADSILDEMLERMGYKADTVAGKLKQVEKSDFLTLENAWEAHKIRNKIVHEIDCALSKREAERIIELYRSVFKEFQFI